MPQLEKLEVAFYRNLTEQYQVEQHFIVEEQKKNKI